MFRYFLLVVVLFTCAVVYGQNTFVAISVPNADASANWYADTLEFKEVHRSEAPNGLARAVIMESPNYGMLEIVQHKDAVPLAKLKPEAKGPHEVHGIFKTGFFVTGIDALYASLKRKNIEFVGGMYDDKPLRLKSFIIRDNSGILIQFLERMAGQAVK